MKEQRTDPFNFSKNNNWVYLGKTTLNNTTNNAIKYTITNRRVVKIEGNVWRDMIQSKLNQYNHIIDGGDQMLSGIKVSLCKKNGTVIAETLTDANGHYEFNKKANGEDIIYWDLSNCYVKFEYDNDEYNTVLSFTGDDRTKNSKAKEVAPTNMTLNDQAILDDKESSGSGGIYPGYAITYNSPQSSWKDNIQKDKRNYSTYKDTNILTEYYNPENFTVENINLGLMGKNKPEFTIAEELAYVKVQMNGFTYTYNYATESAKLGDGRIVTNTSREKNGNESDSITGDKVPDGYVSKFAPTTSAETPGTFTYDVEVYPSDIAYSVEKNFDASSIGLYAIYKITIRNDEVTDKYDLYDEQKLYLTALTNTFDSNRYEIYTEEVGTDENKDHFKLWDTSTIEKGKPWSKISYDVENSSYKQGIKEGEELETYIQLKMKDDALTKILENPGATEDELKEETPTLTRAYAYHDYLRADDYWKQDTITSWRDGVADNDKSLEAEYSFNSGASNKKYVHHSLDSEQLSYSVNIRMKLGETRTISGRVFEDTVDEADSRNTTNGSGEDINKSTLGNGMYDNNDFLSVDGVALTYENYGTTDTYGAMGTIYYAVSTDANVEPAPGGWVTNYQDVTVRQVGIYYA